MELYKIKNLSFAYPDSKHKVLSDINLDIDSGSFTIVTGNSASGKSTLLKIMSGSLVPKGAVGGECILGGVSVFNEDKTPFYSAVSYVPQEVGLGLVTENVDTCLAFTLENLGVEPNEIKKRVYEIASYFNMSKWFKKKISNLSGGQKQMLLLASAMITNPKVLLLDEPTSSLDPILSQEFFNIIKKINTDFNTTIIVVEHKIENIISLCDRLVVLDKGKIICCDTASNVLRQLSDSKPDTLPVSEFTSGLELFNAFKTDNIPPITVKDAITYIKKTTVAGQGCGQDNPKKSHNIFSVDDKCDDEIVKLKNVSFAFDKNSCDVLDSVSLGVSKGEVLAILGENGAGKTTLLKVLSGVSKPYSGKIFIDKKNITTYKGDTLYNNLVTALPQNPKHIFTCRTIVKEFDEMSDDSLFISSLIKLFDIGAILDKHPYDVSYGQMQRVALCKVMLTKPKILLLDEPTSGLDASNKKSLGDILQRVAKSGVAIVMVTHDMDFVAQNCDKCSLLFNGELTTPISTCKFLNDNYFYTTFASKVAREFSLTSVTTTALIQDIKDIKE